MLILKSDNYYKQSGYAIVTSIKGSDLVSLKEEVEPLSSEQLPFDNLNSQESVKSEKLSNSYYSNIETAGFDSTNLSHLYKESTLHVQVNIH